MFKVKQENDWWEELPPASKGDIEKALKDLDDGKGIPHKKIKQMYPQWFAK